MNRGMVFVLMAVIAPTCPARQEASVPAHQGDKEWTDPKEILRKADEATKKVKSVRYVGEFRGTGTMERAPMMVGTVILAGESEEGLDKFRFEVKIKDPVSNVVQDIVAVSNGQRYWLINHQNKTVEEDIDEIVLGGFGQRSVYIGMREFVHPKPFEDEINGQKAELRGIEKVGSEDCYKIYVQYAQDKGGGEAVWWFSRKDFLPRGVERMISPPAQSGAEGTAEKPAAGGLLLKITEFTPDPVFATDPFTVVIPEGYKKLGGTPEPQKPAEPPKDKP